MPTDMEENEKTVSSCCYAPVIGLLSRCSACGGSCSLTWPPCPLNICDGSGIVARTHYDSDSHTYQPDGEELCECGKDEPEHND